MTTSPPPIDPFSSADLGPLKLRNRFVKAATFEGLTRRRWSPTGSSNSTGRLPLAGLR